MEEKAILNSSPSYVASQAVGGGGFKRPLLTVKDFLWFWYLHPLRFASRWLPPRCWYAVGRAIEPLCQVLTRGRRRVVERRLSIARDGRCSCEEVKICGRDFVSNAMWRALDDLIMAQPSSGVWIERVEVRGLEHLERARSLGKGVMVISGHFYANRLAKRYLIAAGYPLMSVRHGRPLDRGMGRVGKRLMRRQYDDFLHEVIRDEVLLQDPELSLKIFQRLRSGGLVDIHIDTENSAKCISLPFLGESKRFATGFLEIVRLTGCPVVPMLCLGNTRGMQVIFEEPLAFVPSTKRDEFIGKNLPFTVSLVERQILDHPSEWEGWVRM